MLYRALVFDLYQQTSLGGVGVFATVLLVYHRRLVKDVLVPVIGAGGPEDAGRMPLAECTPYEQRQIMEALHSGEALPLDQVSGSWVVVAPLDQGAQFVVVSRLPHPRTAVDLFGGVKEGEPAPIPRSVRGVTAEVEPPEPVGTEDKDAYKRGYLTGYGVGVADYDAGLPQKAKQTLETEMASVGDERWDSDSNMMTDFGRGWLDGYSAGYRAAREAPDPAVEAVLGEQVQRDKDGGKDDGRYAAVAPVEGQDAYLEHKGVRIRIGQSGASIDVRDSGGEIRLQGPVRLVVDSSELAVESDGVAVDTDERANVTAKGDITIDAGGGVTIKAAGVLTITASSVTVQAASMTVTGAVSAGSVAAGAITGPAGAPAALTGGLNVTGAISADGQPGVSGTYPIGQGSTLTVKNGIVTGVA